jgi:hypothetical protein
MYWIFVIIITLLACCESVLGIPYYIKTYIYQDEPTAINLRNGLMAVYSLEFVCAVVMMYVLMLAVYKIRKFYKDNKVTEEMNTKAMIIHVLAFGGYIVALLVLQPIVILMFAFPYWPEIFIVFDFAIIPLTITATLSQVLLCAIFWKFGGKLAAQPTRDTEAIEPLLV